MRARRVHIYAAAACFILLVAAGAWAWHAQPVSVDLLFAVLRKHAHDPAAPLAVVLVYVIAGLGLVPVVALIAVTGLAFGPVKGTLYALRGALASGACSYAVGRYFSAPLLERCTSPRVAAVRNQFRTRGLWAVVVVRVVPSGPYTLVNVIAGASGIRLTDFLLGTLIGMTPGIVATVGLVHGARTLWLAPGAWTAAALVAAIVAAVAAARFVRSRLRAQARFKR